MDPQKLFLYLEPLFEPLDQKWQAVAGRPSLIDPVKQCLMSGNLQEISSLSARFSSLADEIAGPSSEPGLTWPWSVEKNISVSWEVSYCMAMCWFARLLGQLDASESRESFLLAQMIKATVHANQDEPR